MATAASITWTEKGRGRFGTFTASGVTADTQIFTENFGIQGYDMLVLPTGNTGGAQLSGAFLEMADASGAYIDCPDNGTVVDIPGANFTTSLMWLRGAPMPPLARLRWTKGTAAATDLACEIHLIPRD